MKTNKLLILTGFLGITYITGTATANPLTICKMGQCAPSGTTLSAEQLYDHLNILFDTNIAQNMTFCQADPISKSCYRPDINVSATSPIIHADIYLSKATVLDAKKGRNPYTLSTILDMDVEANGTYPSCESIHSIIAVNSAEKITITGHPFKCTLTGSTDTLLTLNFDVDFVDFDAGKIGAYYNLTAKQAMNGEASGYTVLTLPRSIATTFELKYKPAIQTELIPAVQSSADEPTCAPCKKDEIQIHSEMARQALAEANQAEIMAKLAMEQALQKAEQAARATEEVAAQKAVAAELAKQEADTAARMAEQARMRVSDRAAAINGQTPCQMEKTADCPKCAKCPKQKMCKHKKSADKPCGCMTGECPYKTQMQSSVSEEIQSAQESIIKEPQETVAETPQSSAAKTATKKVVKSASAPKTTVTQTITRKRVVTSNGQIVEETEDTEIVPANKIMSQDQINAISSTQKTNKKSETVAVISVKDPIATEFVIPTYKKEETFLDKLAKIFWLDAPQN